MARLVQVGMIDGRLQVVREQGAFGQGQQRAVHLAEEEVPTVGRGRELRDIAVVVMGVAGLPVGIGKDHRHVRLSPAQEEVEEALHVVAVLGHPVGGLKPKTDPAHERLDHVIEFSLKNLRQLAGRIDVVIVAPAGAGHRLQQVFIEFVADAHRWRGTRSGRGPAAPGRRSPGSPPRPASSWLPARRSSGR